MKMITKACIYIYIYIYLIFTIHFRLQTGALRVILVTYCFEYSHQLKYTLQYTVSSTTCLIKQYTKIP